MEPLLTTEDVANFLRVDVVTVRRLVLKGELPAYRVGGEYRFIRNEIEDYVKRQRVASEDVIFKDKFDKFTERARKVLTLSKEEARQMRHSFVGTEHLLLALVREGEGVAAKALENLGVVDFAQVRELVESFVGVGEREIDGEIGMTGRAKKVIQLAVEEARELGHRYLGTEHLLLGLLREGEGIGAKVLAKLNIRLEQVRTQVLQVLSTVESGRTDVEPPTT
ncbi:MAG: hypothetical protein NVS4B12_08250 [Ktedonobacteraceae bacterium]